MNRFLTVLMIASFSGSMAMAELGLHDIADTDLLREFGSRDPESKLVMKDAISFKLPSVLLKTQSHFGPGFHEYSFVYRVLTLEAAKKAFSTAHSNEEKLKILLSASPKSKIKNADHTLITYVKPLHRAELNSLYRHLSGGKEMPAEIIAAYLELLGQNEISAVGIKKLGLNLGAIESGGTLDYQTQRQVLQLIDIGNSFTVIPKVLPDSKTIGLIDKTNPEPINAEPVLRYRSNISR